MERDKFKISKHVKLPHKISSIKLTFFRMNSSSCLTVLKKKFKLLLEVEKRSSSKPWTKTDMLFSKYLLIVFDEFFEVGTMNNIKKGSLESEVKIKPEQQYIMKEKVAARTEERSNVSTDGVKISKAVTANSIKPEQKRRCDKGNRIFLAQKKDLIS